MSDAPIQIRKPEVIRDIRELAEESGQPFTDVVGDAVRKELERRREARQEAIEAKLARLNAIVDELHALPVVGSLITDADIYDEDGLPK